MTATTPCWTHRPERRGEEKSSADHFKYHSSKTADDTVFSYFCSSYFSMRCHCHLFGLIILHIDLMITHQNRYNQLIQSNSNHQVITDTDFKSHILFVMQLHLQLHLHLIQQETLKNECAFPIKATLKLYGLKGVWGVGEICPK